VAARQWGLASLVVRAAVLAVGVLGLASGVAPSATATAPYMQRLPPLLTPWTRSVSTVAPLPEYPRPQLERSRWLSLNGRWQYEPAQPGQPPPFGQSLAQTILVPFPVESPLSGVQGRDSMGWYRRSFTVPATWSGQRVRLNFGAVSWLATVYVNGRVAGVHRGDYDSFSFDITRLLRRGVVNELIVGFYDPIGGAGEPVGKQTAGAPSGILHTASSGIWQTVWLEPVSPEHVTGLDLAPDLARSRLVITTAVAGGRAGRVLAQALSGGHVIATMSGRPGWPFALPIAKPHPWSPSDPYLYTLHLRIVSGRRTLDDVKSYFGMRSVSLGRAGGATRILLNGRFLFQTGALDQGYWPDGLYTPPTDSAMRFDVLAAKHLGYDMLREHEKVQADRWYYWADRLGILVWQDMPSMRVPYDRLRPAENEFRRELSAVVVEHRSHPSIVTWIPFNEGADQFNLKGVTKDVRALDRGALVDADSGSASCCNAIESPITAVRDSHMYFGPFAVPADYRASVIGEYGGVLPFPPAGHRWPGTLTSLGSPVAIWGPQPVARFLRAQYAELAEEIRVRGLSGAVFTELAGYEDELGILTYDREAYTIAPSVVRGLNESLIAASEQPSELRPQAAGVPVGTVHLWRFAEGHGNRAADTARHGEPLRLQGGIGWTRGRHGGALSITAPGQTAVGQGDLVNTGRSFTISAWLSSRKRGQSGSAVSELGSDGSSFSLGLQTAPQGAQSLTGLDVSGTGPAVGDATWWTFAVPASSGCTVAQCGVDANLRYADGRLDPRPGSWHQVTGVYNGATQTTTLYVDGVAEDVEHVFGIPRGPGPLTVGTGNGVYLPTDAFIGAVSELRVYARAISPAEVWELYRAESA
jgi:hypothetical protein